MSLFTENTSFKVSQHDQGDLKTDIEGHFHGNNTLAELTSL